MLLIKGSPLQLCFLIFTTITIQNNEVMFAKIIDSFGVFSRFVELQQASYLLACFCVLILYLPVIWYIYISLFKRVIDTNIDFRTHLQ